MDDRTGQTQLYDKEREKRNRMRLKRQFGMSGGLKTERRGT